MYSQQPPRHNASGFGPTVPGDQRSLNSELWHACAGPLVSVPPIGSRVVYFPQGHSEQVAASTQKEADVHIPSYPNLPSRLICLLDNVTLHADLETDEVYTRMTLIPLNPQEKDHGSLPEVPRESKQPTDFFCKTLTASDTSTHGGFSIPRRAAEKVFPPLDYTTPPPAHPAQSLVARDLHDNEWNFRHIYRGQPRRHLLTTGWSVFVSAKRLQAGDSVLFIRDDKGQLLLGVRRANRQQTAMPSSVLTSDSMHIGVLAAANHAAATNSRFTIFYNPRASPSEFVIPLAKYNKAVHHTQVSVGMRFRMVFETEESGVRRYMGTITGIGDLDPIRWPNSHWRSLKVGWDESTAGERQKRVSLWEIEPLTTPFLICAPLPMRKRPRAPSRGQSGISGEEEDVDGLQKKSSLWLRDDGDRDTLSRLPYGGLQSSLHGMEPWRMPQRQDNDASQNNYYRAMAAAALQEIRDPPKQMMLHQSQQQQPQSMPMQQQQPPMQQQQQRGMHFRSAPQQQKPQQSQEQPQPLQHQQQQQASQHFQSQLKLPDLPGSSVMPISVSRPQSPMQLPLLRGPTSSFLESDLHLSPTSTSSGAFPLQSLLGRPSQQGNVLPADDTAHFQSLLRSNQNAISQSTLVPAPGAGPCPSPGPGPGMGRDTSAPSPWFPPAMRDSSKLGDTPSLPSLRLGCPDTSSPPGGSFMSQNESVQSGLAPLPGQQAPSFPVFHDNPQDHEQVQSDPRSHLIFGVQLDQPLAVQNGVMPPRPLVKGKESNGPSSGPGSTSNRFAGGNVLPPPYCSPPAPEMPISPNMMSNLEDNAFLQRGSAAWPALSSPPMRTFTKVYKLGSVGRSIDLTRHSNYPELRAALARMFGLEGQIEDPQRSTWQLVFVDNEGDVLLLGDDPWEEFVNCVRCIRIMSPSEVKQMSQEGSEILNFVPPSVARPTSSGSEDGAAARQDHRNASPANPNGGILEH